MAGRMPAPVRAARAARLLRTRRRGQVIVLALVIILLFLLAAAVLVDVYQIEEGRNWGYRVAQQAALAGASAGRDWSHFQPTVDPAEPTPTPSTPPCADPGEIQLDADEAEAAAENALEAEMGARGFAVGTYTYDIRVLPDPGGGGPISDFPPLPVRLSADRYWSAENPAVGVYLSFPVYTFFMSIVGRDSVPVHVFAAAEAAQPAACP